MILSLIFVYAFGRVSEPLSDFSENRKPALAPHRIHKELRRQQKGPLPWPDTKFHTHRDQQIGNYESPCLGNTQILKSSDTFLPSAERKELLEDFLKLAR